MLIAFKPFTAFILLITISSLGVSLAYNVIVPVALSKIAVVLNKLVSLSTLNTISNAVASISKLF